MNKISIVSIVSIVLLGTFLSLDGSTYYYGLGKGFIVPKIPNRFSIIFAGSDLGNQGVVLKEKDMNTWVIFNNNTVPLSNTKNKIKINIFLGYWFTSKSIIANIKDEKGNNRHIEIYEEASNSLYPKYFCNEINFKPVTIQGIKYINLDKSLEYLKKMKFIKNTTFILWLLSTIYFLKLLLWRWRKQK